jgi:DNA-binding HxlR family transcriptional regulator
VSISLEILGDRWTLLVVRDLMVRGYRKFKEFQGSGEGIATNVLADRLRRLQAAGIVTSEAEQSDARRVNYRLTRKGVDLAPLLFDLLEWGARHERTSAPAGFLDKVDREAFLAEVRRRWEARDTTPLLSPFKKSRKGEKQ